MSAQLLPILTALQPLSATAAQTGGPAIVNGPGTQCADTELTVTVTSGRGPYTYLWSKVAGSGGVFSGGTSATCTVQHCAVTPFSTSGTFKCTVTDAIGRSSDSNNVEVTFTGTDL